MVNIALIGCGRIGQMHAANLAKHERTNLVAVCDAAEKSAERIAHLYGCKVVDSPSKIFGSENIDGVIITTIYKRTI